MGRTALVAPAAVLALAATLGLSACAADVDPAEEAAEKGPAARPNYAVRMDSPSSNPADFQLVDRVPFG